MSIPRINEVLIVEGRYDKIKLDSILDADIICTNGFGIFNDNETASMLCRLAEKRGVVILTDSDGAGFLIRNHLNGILPQDRVKHAYIPEIPGKERRKAAPGREGLLGVEGVSSDVILEALRRAGVTFDDTAPIPDKPEKRLTKQDLYRLGLSGGPNSAALREELKKKLNLPSHLSPNALLRVLNILCTSEELEHLITDIDSL